MSSRQEGLTSQQLQLTGSCLSPTGGKHVTKQSERESKDVALCYYIDARTVQFCSPCIPSVLVHNNDML